MELFDGLVSRGGSPAPLGLVVVLESRQRWFDAGLGDRIERWIERNPPDRVRRSGAGKNSLLRPLRRGKGRNEASADELAHHAQIFSRISGRCGLDKGLPLDPVCRQQIDGKFRSQILTGEPAQTTNFRPPGFRLISDYR